MNEKLNRLRLTVVNFLNKRPVGKPLIITDAWIQTRSNAEFLELLAQGPSYALLRAECERVGWHNLEIKREWLDDREETTPVPAARFYREVSGELFRYYHVAVAKNGDNSPIEGSMVLARSPKHAVEIFLVKSGNNDRARDPAYRFWVVDLNEGTEFSARVVPEQIVVE